MTAHFNGGMELRFCFVTSLLSWTLLRFCVSESFVGKVLDLNTNLLLLGKWPRSSLAVQRALFAYFSLFFCPIAGLQCSIVKLKIVGAASFLTRSWRSLKEGPNKLLTTRFCSKLSSVKCFTQTREGFEGMKHSLFIFVSHSLLSFGSWGNLKVLNFYFQWVSSEVHVNLKPKQFQISRISRAHQQWRHNFYFRTVIRHNYPTILPTALRLWRIKNSDFNIPISPQCFVQCVWNFRICLFYT